MPEISIIVPVYNAEKYLERCLNSLLHQSFSDFELLLIDDGSTDMSSQICDQYAKVDERVKIFHQANAGAGAARNSGLDHACGKYIMFVDSDDYVSADFFKIMYEWIEKLKCDIVQCDFVITHDINCEFYKSGDEFCYEYQLDTMACYFSNRYHWTGVFWNKIYRKELWNDLRIPEDIICEDTAILHEVFFKSNNFFYTSQKLYAYFQSENSVTRNNYSIRDLDLVKAREMRNKFIHDHRLVDYYAIMDGDLFGQISRSYYLLRHNMKGQTSEIYILKAKLRSICKELIKNDKIGKKSKLNFMATFIFPTLMSSYHYKKWQKKNN